MSGDLYMDAHLLDGKNQSLREVDAMDAWRRRYELHLPAQSKRERQWRSTQQPEPSRAVEDSLTDKFNTKLAELEACETVEDLKRFMRENML